MNVNRMDNDIFCAEYFYLQFLKSLIQRIEILSGHKYATQSKHWESWGRTLQGCGLRTRR